eukprot:UN17290
MTHASQGASKESRKPFPAPPKILFVLRWIRFAPKARTLAFEHQCFSKLQIFVNLSK